MISTLIALFVATLSFKQARSQTTAVNNVACPQDWVMIGEHCYLGLEAASTWEDANVRCHSYGGYILVLESADEFNAVNNVIPMLSSVWLGCTNRPNMAIWLCHGENYSTAISWTPGQLDEINDKERCIHIKGQNPSYRDEYCLLQKPFICEGKPEELHASQFGFTCPHGWIQHDSRCYFQGGDRLSWERSQMFCESFGGNLLTVDTEEELKAVAGVFHPDEDWIGCRDHSSSKQYLCFWANMTSVIEWAPNEPGQSAACVGVDSQFQMVTNLCTKSLDFICEVELSALNVGITGDCPPSWIRANDNCYFYSYSQMTWDAASEYCKDAVSQLIVPETTVERDLLRNLFSSNIIVWIGCKKSKGNNELQCQGSWAAFLDFAENVKEMDEEYCVVMEKDGYYKRVECSSTERNFVCQMPKEQYLGCNVDASERALAGDVFILENNNNLKNCVAACSTSNYIYVGLQNNKYCYCGNEQYSRYGRRPNWECDEICSGQEGQYCGGDLLSLVYKAPMGHESAAVTREYDLQHGKRMFLYVHTTLFKPTLLACAIACTSNDWCLSFNFCDNGQEVTSLTKNCELITGLRSHVVQSEYFLSDDFCIFGEVDP